VRGSIAALAGVWAPDRSDCGSRDLRPDRDREGHRGGSHGARNVLTGRPLDWTDRALGVLPVLGTFGEEVRTGEQWCRRARSSRRRPGRRLLDQRGGDEGDAADGAARPVRDQHTGPDNFLVAVAAKTSGRTARAPRTSSSWKRSTSGTPPGVHTSRNRGRRRSSREKILNETEDEFRPLRSRGRRQRHTGARAGGHHERPSRRTVTSVVAGEVPHPRPGRGQAVRSSRP